jgi:hypothetical protein
VRLTPVGLVLLLAGCGFTPVQELSPLTPQPDGGTTPLGASTTGLSWASCAPNDGPATAVLIDGKTCAERSNLGLVLTVWGAPLTPGTTFFFGGGLGAPGGTAERCTSAGCEQFVGSLTIRSVSDAGLSADFDVSADGGAGYFGRVETLACPGLGLCG